MVRRVENFQERRGEQNALPKRIFQGVHSHNPPTRRANVPKEALGHLIQRSRWRLKATRRAMLPIDHKIPSRKTGCAPRTTLPSFAKPIGSLTNPEGNPFCISKPGPKRNFEKPRNVAAGQK